MKIEEPSVEWQPSLGTLKDIERAARTCYASAPKGNTEEFVDRLVKQDHGRPLEFGTVRLGIPDTHQFASQIEFFKKNPYSKHYIENGIVYVTTNYRVIVENGLEQLLVWNILFQQDTDITKFEKRDTAKWSVSRGIADEFRTHGTLSGLMQSTRYCDYSKGKFGHEITFIRPRWFAEHKWRRRVMKLSWWISEKMYMLLKRMGCTAQEARDVLPLGIKAELVQCGFDDAWDNFWYRRCAKDAHPDARYIADIAREKRN